MTHKDTKALDQFHLESAAQWGREAMKDNNPPPLPRSGDWHPNESLPDVIRPEPERPEPDVGERDGRHPTPRSKVLSDKKTFLRAKGTIRRTNLPSMLHRSRKKEPRHEYN